jgi:CDP-diacylglycerol pyrophosphatase
MCVSTHLEASGLTSPREELCLNLRLPPLQPLPQLPHPSLHIRISIYKDAHAPSPYVLRKQGRTVPLLYNLHIQGRTRAFTLESPQTRADSDSTLESPYTRTHTRLHIRISIKDVHAPSHQNVHIQGRTRAFTLESPYTRTHTRLHIRISIYKGGQCLYFRISIYKDVHGPSHQNLHIQGRTRAFTLDSPYTRTHTRLHIRISIYKDVHAPSHQNLHIQGRTRTFALESPYTRTYTGLHIRISANKGGQCLYFRISIYKDADIGTEVVSFRYCAAQKS